LSAIRHTSAVSSGPATRPFKGRAALLLRAVTVALFIGEAIGCAPRVAPPHVLVIADTVDPTSLNPLLAHDQDTIAYDLLVTQTLVGLSAVDRLVPILVTRIPTRANGDISADGRTIVYHLRHGVRFADGSPLTSADVSFTFRAILDSRNPVESQDAYRQVAWLRTPDASTVVRLKRRWNAAVAELFGQADFAFGILPAHAFASTDVTRGEWDDRPFGTGPFRVTQWQRANRIVLEANPYFRPPPKLQRIVLRLLPNTTAALFALRTGEVDVAEIGVQQVAQARTVRDAHLLVTPVNGAYLLMMQTTTSPTDDLRARRTIAAAIDRRAIAAVTFGLLPAADSFLPPTFAWHTGQPPFEALRPPGSLHVTIAMQPDRGTWLPVMLQEQLRRHGIDADVKPYPAAMFNAPAGPLRSGRFTLALAQWIGGGDPEQSVIFACGQRGEDGNNAMNYCDRRFDALFAEQSTTADPGRRRADFVGMQRLIARDVPAVPLVYEANFDVVRDRVRGFTRNMLMYPVAPESWDVR
jgi:peptide/nickel transport system substrate-binding protein